ncbi:histone deacetylase [Corynebacteriaceae bacterium 6-324]
MAFKKALATVAVSATAAAVLVSTAGADEKTISVGQGDLVGSCFVSFNDPSTNRSYLADYCGDGENPTRLYGENNKPVDNLGTFHASGLSGLGTNLAYIQWDDEVEVESNDFTPNNWDNAPAPGDAVSFSQFEYEESPAESGEGVLAGEINGTYFVDFGEYNGTAEEGTGLLDGTTVWTTDGLLGVVNGRFKNGSHPHLTLVASPEATGGATGDAVKEERTKLFDAHFNGTNPTPTTSEESSTPESTTESSSSQPTSEPSESSSASSTTAAPSPEPSEPNTPQEPSADASSIGGIIGIILALVAALGLGGAATGAIQIPGLGSLNLDLNLPF